MVNGQRRNTNKTESVWHGTGTSGKTTFWNLYHATEKERIFVEEEERNGWHGTGKYGKTPSLSLCHAR